MPSLPIVKNIDITAAQSYVLELNFCGQQPAQVSALAYPVFDTGYTFSISPPGYISYYGTRLQDISFNIGDQLVCYSTQMSGTVTIISLSPLNSPSIPLSVSSQSDRVVVTFPFGQQPLRPLTGVPPCDSPRQYTYSVTGPDNAAYAGGTVRLSIKDTVTSTTASLTLCGVTVRGVP